VAPGLDSARSPQETNCDMKNKSVQIGLGIAFGAALSIALGAGSGWLALGIAGGIGIGVAIPRTSSHKTNDRRPTIEQRSSPWHY
jgi:hypothetical protein